MSESLLAQLRSGSLSIRQRTGKENALGPVKFIFPNEYNVYFHGTPAQALFASRGETSAMAAFACRIRWRSPNGCCATRPTGQRIALRLP